MNDKDRFKLRFGNYETPRFKYGNVAKCKVRGEVIITGLHEGPIPWPMGRSQGHGGAGSLIVYRGLAKAVRRESKVAVCHWWNVSPSTVGTWRSALGVPRANEGSTELWAEHFEGRAIETRRKAIAKARDPQRRAKIAAAKRGKKRPAYVVEAMRKRKLGTRHSEETRRKMAETHRKRGTRPPWIGEPWTVEEDQIVREHTIREAAIRTGRTESAVRSRRQKLRLPDGRRRKN